jgi:hypothetical protein
VDGQVAAAWIAEQDLRLMYRAKSRDLAERRLQRWLVLGADSNVSELPRLAAPSTAGATSWSPTSTPAAAPTGRGQASGFDPTKIMNRIGFRNFDKCRLRLLLHCVGRQTPSPTPLRYRLPGRMQARRSGR